MLFVAPRGIAIQGELPFVRIDGDGLLQRTVTSLSASSTKPSQIETNHHLINCVAIGFYPEEYERYRCSRLRSIRALARSQKQS